MEVLKRQNPYTVYNNQRQKLQEKFVQGGANSNSKEAEKLRQLLQLRYKTDKFLKDIKGRSEWEYADSEIKSNLDVALAKVNFQQDEEVREKVYEEVIAKYKDRALVQKSYVSRLINELNQIYNQIGNLEEVNKKKVEGLKNELEKHFIDKKFWNYKNSAYEIQGEKDDIITLIAQARSVIDYSAYYAALGLAGELATAVGLSVTQEKIDNEVNEILQALGIEEGTIKSKVVGTDTVQRVTIDYGSGKEIVTTQKTQDKVDVIVELKDKDIGTPKTLGLSVKSYEYTDNISILSGNGYSIMSEYQEFLNHLSNLLYSSDSRTTELNKIKTYNFIKATIGLHALIGRFKIYDEKQGVIHSKGADYFVAIERSAQSEDRFKVYSTKDMAIAILENLTNSKLRSSDDKEHFINLSHSAERKATRDRIMKKIDTQDKNVLHQEYQKRFANLQVMLHLTNLKNSLPKT